MYRHRSSSFAAGFRQPQFADGVRDLSSVPLNQKQLDAIVANAVSISAPSPDIEPVTAGSEEITTEAFTAEAPEVSDEPVAEASESAELGPHNSQDAPPITDLLTRTTEYARQGVDNLWKRLSDYKFPNDALRSRRSELFDELLSIIERAGALFADAHVVKMAAFAEQHEALRIECRAALERIEKLTKELGPIDGQLRTRQTKSSEARLLLAGEEDSRPRAERYPSSREIALWEERVRKARSALATAVAEEAEYGGVRNQVLREIREENALLNGGGGRPGLKHKEIALRATLEGKAFVDVSTGLTVHPEF